MTLLLRLFGLLCVLVAALWLALAVPEAWGAGTPIVWVLALAGPLQLGVFGLLGFAAARVIDWLEDVYLSVVKGARRSGKAPMDWD